VQKQGQEGHPRKPQPHHDSQEHSIGHPLAVPRVVDAWHFAWLNSDLRRVKRNHPEKVRVLVDFAKAKIDPSPRWASIAFGTSTATNKFRGDAAEGSYLLG